MTFRAADTVHHGPSGENWILAVDEEQGRVMPAGWPQTMAEAKDCTLIKAATDAGRAAMLRAFAGSTGSDLRISMARHQLKGINS